MSFFAGGRRFFGSRSGHAFLLQLGVCGALCRRGRLRVLLFGPELVCRAQERGKGDGAAARRRLRDDLFLCALAIRRTARLSLQRSRPRPSKPSPSRMGGEDVFRLRSGRPIQPGNEEPGRQTPRWPRPSKPSKLSAKPKPKSGFLVADGQVLFRTVYPTFAREESCVACHNQLQPGAHWRADNESHGRLRHRRARNAVPADEPAAGPHELGLGLFVALGLVGFFISRQHFAQITEREKAAAEIGRARQFLDTVVQNIPAVVTVKDIDSGKYVLANRSAESLFGVASEDIVGKARTRLAAGDRGLFARKDREATESGVLPAVDERDLRTADGETRILGTKKLPIPGDAGEPRYLLTLSEDITERKHAEARSPFWRITTR